MKTLQQLFLDELADMLDAETRLTQALPKLAKAAESDELRAALESHLRETEGQVDKIEAVFRAFGQGPKSKKCEAIAGLLKEGDRIVSENKGSPTMDAALISAAQKVEHYEIASYGCLREWAEQLGNDSAALTLTAILNEEKAADRTLTQFARHGCNVKAEIGDAESASTRGTRPQVRSGDYRF